MLLLSLTYVAANKKNAPFNARGSIKQTVTFRLSRWRVDCGMKGSRTAVLFLRDAPASSFSKSRC
jgi:hypothetical protein